MEITEAGINVHTSIQGTLMLSNACSPSENQAAAIAYISHSSLPVWVFGLDSRKSSLKWGWGISNTSAWISSLYILLMAFKIFFLFHFILFYFLLILDLLMKSEVCKRTNYKAKMPLTISHQSSDTDSHAHTQSQVTRKERSFIHRWELFSTTAQ